MMPLKKAEFNRVLELYEASVGKDEYPNHGCRTEDGRIAPPGLSLRDYPFALKSLRQER